MTIAHFLQGFVARDEALRNQIDEKYPVKPACHVNPNVPAALSLHCLA